MENSNSEYRNSKLIIPGDLIFLDGNEIRVKTIDGVKTGDNCVTINRKYQVYKNETVKWVGHTEIKNSNNEQKSVEELAEEKYPMNKIEAIGTKQYVDEMTIIHNQRLAFIAGHTAATEGRVKKDEWINVKDALPEDGQEVNIIVSGKTRISTFRINNGFKSFYCGSDERMCYGKEFITHWIPLPTPPNF